MSWSSALRLAGLSIVRRATWGAGKSRRSFPEASSWGLLEDNERVALRHRLALLDEDLAHRALVLRLDGHLHLHRLEDHDRVALLDRVSDLHLDLPDGARDVRLDAGHCAPSSAIAAGDDSPRRR